MTGGAGASPITPDGRWSAVPRGCVGLARMLAVANVSALGLAAICALCAFVEALHWAMACLSLTLFSASLGVTSATDILYRRIPTPLARSMWACGAAFSICISCIACDPATTPTLAPGLLRTLIGAIAMAALALSGSLLASIFSRRRTSEGASVVPPVGGGDLRLIVGVGCLLGMGSMTALLLSCVAAALWCLASRSPGAPFAPCLAVPCLVVALTQACQLA